MLNLKSDQVDKARAICGHTLCPAAICSGCHKVDLYLCISICAFVGTYFAQLPSAQVAIKSPRGTNTKDSISCVHISHSICCHFWIIFTDQVCDCMEQKTCNRSGLNFIRTCFSPWNWFNLAFRMSLNMCLCTLFQTCFLPEIYPLLLSKCVCLCTRAGISAVDERKQVWEIFNLEIWISLQLLQRKIKRFGKTKMFNLRIWFWCLEKTKFSI